MTEGKPTPKQAQVLGYIKQGKTATQIAKRMKITRNGVYAHKKHLRELGLLDEANEAAPEPEATTPEATNGHDPATPQQIRALAEQAAQRVAERVEQINGRIEEITAAQEKLAAERSLLNEEADQLASQRKVLEQV